jgi:hypothetical protein
VGRDKYPRSSGYGNAWEIFSALVYRELKLTVGEAKASLGDKQVHLSAARVDPGSVTRHDDHDDIRIVPVGETSAVIRYRAA